MTIVDEISTELLLPVTGKEQDWDIEMADSSRIIEFLEYFRNNDFSVGKKVAVMALLISSYEDFLNIEGSAVDSRWDEIRSTLASDKIIFQELINYWAYYEDNDCFKISPLIRAL